MVGTLDNCLTRLGQRDSAKALREFAVVNGVWAHADRQNDGVLVAFPGMDAKPWCFGKNAAAVFRCASCLKAFICPDKLGTTMLDPF